MRACFGIARSSPFKQVALRSFSFLRDPNRTAEHLNSTRLQKSCASSSARLLGAKQVPGSPSKLSEGPAAKLGSPMKLIGDIFSPLFFHLFCPWVIAQGHSPSLMLCRHWRKSAGCYVPRGVQRKALPWAGPAECSKQSMGCRSVPSADI